MRLIRDIAGYDIAVVMNCHFVDGALNLDGQEHIIVNNIFECAPGPCVQCCIQAEPRPAACGKCFWHIYTGTGGSPDPDMWYLHRCGTKGTPIWNPVEGTWEMGEYPYCRDVNTDGKCRMFTDKEGLR